MFCSIQILKGEIKFKKNKLKRLHLVKKELFRKVFYESKIFNLCL